MSPRELAERVAHAARGQDADRSGAGGCGPRAQPVNLSRPLAARCALPAVVKVVVDDNQAVVVSARQGSLHLLLGNACPRPPKTPRMHAPQRVRRAREDTGHSRRTLGTSHGARENAIAWQDLVLPAMLRARRFRPPERCPRRLQPGATRAGAAGCRRAPPARGAACSRCPVAPTPSTHPHSISQQHLPTRGCAPRLAALRARARGGHLQVIGRATATTGRRQLAHHVARKRRLPGPGQPAEEQDAAAPALLSAPELLHARANSDTDLFFHPNGTPFRIETPFYCAVIRFRPANLPKANGRRRPRGGCACLWWAGRGVDHQVGAQGRAASGSV